MSEQDRKLLLELMEAGINGVYGRTRVRDTLWDSDLPANVDIVSIGKAASAMTVGALEALGSRAQRALVITRPGYHETYPDTSVKIVILEAAHPLPDESSIEAGYRLIRFIEESDESTRIVFLVSGGASSLVEVLPSGVTLADLRRANRWLLGSGFSVRQVNALRRRLSCIKGGRLCSYMGDREIEVLLISDVPGDDVMDIGSGLTVRASDPPLPTNIPDWLYRMLERAEDENPPFKGHCNARRISIVARNRDAVDAVLRAAREKEQPAWSYYEPLEGEAEIIGRRCAEFLIDAELGVHVWGGETVVKLPDKPGRGGRNQSLALSAATVIKGLDNILLLAVGTDGSDGPGDDAGALVDGGTVERGSDCGMTPKDALTGADAGTFLAASRDLINTGPTGTNVMDLIIGLKCSTS
ncbi:MAG: DUF4147 domain-containing protein [Gammaproteobacteria bacterium]